VETTTMPDIKQQEQQTTNPEDQLTFRRFRPKKKTTEEPVLVSDNVPEIYRGWSDPL